MAAVAIESRRDRPLVARLTSDRGIVRAFLERDRLFAAYAICDLEDREFARTRWAIALSGEEPVALGLASWLPSSAIADGVYYGIRAGGKLVSAAGTHVISHNARLGVVGNVLTHADHRGRG